MDLNDYYPEDRDTFKRYTPRKNAYTETNSVNGNPKKLQEKSKPDDGMVELEGGFTMYPSEVLEFSEGADSWV